jgi:hypothetical protein
VKRFIAVLAGLVMVTSLVACGKQPVEEITATKAAVEAAVAAGAEQYVADDYKKVDASMAAALEEVKVQDGKMLKNYDKAKQLLAQAKADGEALQGKAVAEKQRLLEQADADLAAAGTAVATAGELVENAPKGKGSAADIMAMKADITGLEAALGEVQPLIDNSEFAAASERAQAIIVKATALSDEIQNVMIKLAALKGTK